MKYARSVCAGFALAVAFSGLKSYGVEGGPSSLPRRLRRAESFLGIHFDFHAGPDCTNVGARTTREMIAAIIDRVKPDYIQIDCKGHPGYSSYPTQVGYPAPGIVGDPLRVWRDVTREKGVALFMHYSGVWDGRAVALHPDWAARGADGKPSDRATSVFGPYVDRLMIPQLRELAGEYGVDGVWVDGDCWATVPDYGETAVKAFCSATGATNAPAGGDAPRWNEWKDFHREAFRRYVRHYVDALKTSHPDFEVISNWAFSDHMPEPVTAGVAALSGDFSPERSVDSARFAGRCLENQGRAWDLMSWSFRRSGHAQKTAIQLQQEAAIVLALGGGYQAYFTQNRDGSVRLEEMPVMADVGAFCRARQPYCHRSQAVPQVALLYSRAGHYRSANALFHPSGSDGIDVMRTALIALLDRQYAVQVVGEHHLAGAMARWPLIVVPGWGYLEPAFRDELAAFVKGGGALLLIGEGPRRLFEKERAAAPAGTGRIAAVTSVGADFATTVRDLFPHPLVEVSGSNEIDVSPRHLGGRLTVNLVNTAGPHDDPAQPVFDRIPPAGPLEVSIRLPRAPRAVTLQPDGRDLPVKWTDGRVTFTVPRVDVHAVIVVEE